MSSSSSPDVGQESLETEDQIKIYSSDFDGYDDHVDSYIALYRWHQIPSGPCHVGIKISKVLLIIVLSQDLEASRLLLHLGQTGSFPVIFSENVWTLIKWFLIIQWTCLIFLGYRSTVGMLSREAFQQNLMLEIVFNTFYPLPQES